VWWLVQCILRRVGKCSAMCSAGMYQCILCIFCSTHALIHTRSCTHTPGPCVGLGLDTDVRFFSIDWAFMEEEGAVCACVCVCVGVCVCEVYTIKFTHFYKCTTHTMCIINTSHAYICYCSTRKYTHTHTLTHPLSYVCWAWRVPARACYPL
jgi:hypothetical protein